MYDKEDNFSAIMDETIEYIGIGSDNLEEDQLIEFYSNLVSTLEAEIQYLSY